MADLKVVFARLEVLFAWKVWHRIKKTAFFLLNLFIFVSVMILVIVSVAALFEKQFHVIDNLPEWLDFIKELQISPHDDTKKIDIRSPLILLAFLSLIILHGDKITKISLFGVNAELQKQSNKNKAMFWIYKGDNAMRQEKVDMALLYYKTALKKNEDISLASLGMANVFRWLLQHKKHLMVDEKNNKFNKALVYCSEAEKNERKWQEEDKDSTIDLGPVYLMRAAIYYAKDRTYYKKEIHTCLNKSLEEFARTAEGDKIYNDHVFPDIYQGYHFFYGNLKAGEFMEETEIDEFKNCNSMKKTQEIIDKLFGDKE